MIDYEKRAMIEAEDKYTFRQSSQISSQTGLIGYLRADMDTDGNAYRDIDPEEDWNYEGTVTTVKEYMEKHPPVLHKEKEQEPVR